MELVRSTQRSIVPAELTPVTPNVTFNDRVRIEVGSIVAKFVGAEKVGVEERERERLGGGGGGGGG